jgi:Stage II sporulation protein E (SpoIIE)
VNYFFTWRNYIRTLVYGYAVAVMVVIVMTIGTPVHLPRLVFSVILIGVCVNTTIWAVEYLFRRQIARASQAGQAAAHVVVCTVAGVLGFVLGRTVNSVILDGRLPTLGTMMPALQVAALVSFFAAVTMFYYIRLENRLREKVREQELAQQELTLARAIQERLLPPPELTLDGVHVTARNLPAHFVAGDFYDLIARSDGTLVVIVGDVAGKGVAASLIMASVKSVLPLIASAGTVEATMRGLNEKLVRELGKREFVALACAAYEPATGKVTLANAVLPDPYVVRDGVAVPLVVEGPRLPLGVRELEYQSVTVSLQPDDRLLLFTDGLAEATMRDGEPLGYERLTGLAAAPTLDELFARIEAQCPGARGDDWTAVLVERR